ncbi:MAG: PAS domain-containing sensor histidine kinase [Betaproteobacteria bacterium]|nr:PAS domain-containing sensor histidine kinase [Betaproteobacteria bacterium]
MSEALPQVYAAPPLAIPAPAHCFEAIAASTNDMISVLDETGARIYVNPAFRALFGEETGAGTDSFAHIHSEDRPRLQSLFRQVMRDGRGQRAEYRVFDARGELRVLESQSNIITCQCGVPRWLVVVSRDTTARRSLEDELAHMRDALEIRIGQRTTELVDANRQLERSVAELRAAHRELREREEDSRRTLKRERELNEMKLRFVSMASHEFRTPLAMILSASDLLRDYDGRLPPDERREMLDDIHAAVWRLTKMLDEVLTLSRADAGRLEFAPRAVSVLALCRDILAERSRACGASHALVLESNQAETERPLDEKLLRLALDNLLANAVRYSPAGSKVRLVVRFAAQETLFEVIDQGIGVPETDQSRIFESFFRASNVGCTPGTGLGLAIVERVLRRHAGTITCTSNLGRGTCMRVCIPMAAVESRGTVEPCRPPAAINVGSVEFF